MSEVVSAFEHTLVGYDEHGALPPPLELVPPIEPEESREERMPHVNPAEAAYSLAQGSYLGRIAAARLRLHYAETYDPQTHESGLTLASWVLPSIRAELRRRYHELAEFEAGWAAHPDELSIEDTEKVPPMPPRTSITTDKQRPHDQTQTMPVEHKTTARSHSRPLTPGSFFSGDRSLPHGKLPPESKVSAMNGLGRELTLLSSNTGEGDEDPRKNGLCAQTDPDIFFPEKGGSTKEAKQVCMACDAREKCLEYALDSDERFGIWGGLSERERRKLKKKRA